MILFSQLLAVSASLSLLALLCSIFMTRRFVHSMKLLERSTQLLNDLYPNLRNIEGEWKMTLPCNEIAAQLMEHLCNHNWHGYTQGGGRWGDNEGYCWVTIDGVPYSLVQGDRDCSSAIIDCWRNAVYYTQYQGCFDDATYTGNMLDVFSNSGLFDVHPMGDGFVAQRGDVYLNVKHHTAMCLGTDPDILGEFLINEKGTITGGIVGDQTGYEAYVRSYYNFPWDYILHYNGKAEDMTPDDLLNAQIAVQDTDGEGQHNIAVWTALSWSYRYSQYCADKINEILETLNELKK